ncbi:hypothetical protein CBL_21023, partial [Carabus blaptoides fortunei]
MARRLQFSFQYVASPKEKKTSIVNITSITTEDNKEYVLRQEMRFISDHEGLPKTDVYKRVKKSFTQRGQNRTVWITLTEEMKQTYFDEEGNIMFNDLYLEELIKTDKVEPTEKKESQLNLKHIAEKFMIEKFTTKHSNAKQWLETFEKECRRFEINEGSTKIEILRLFLDKSYMDNNVTSKTLVLLIAAVLPEFVRNKIDKENCENSTALLHEIRKWENLMNESSFTKKREDKNDNKKRFERKQP